MNMNFDSLNNHDKERYVMELILRVLQSLGGEASKSEVKSEMAKMDEPLADYMDLTKEGKNGPYHPFAFTYNFAIKHLYYADYLTYGRTQPLKLTDKGINVDVDNMDFERDVYAISDEKWRSRPQMIVMKVAMRLMMKMIWTKGFTMTCWMLLVLCLRENSKHLPEKFLVKWASPLMVVKALHILAMVE